MRRPAKAPARRVRPRVMCGVQRSGSWNGLRTPGGLSEATASHTLRCNPAIAGSRSSDQASTEVGRSKRTRPVKRTGSGRAAATSASSQRIGAVSSGQAARVRCGRLVGER